MVFTNAWPSRHPTLDRRPSIAGSTPHVRRPAGVHCAHQSAFYEGSRDAPGRRHDAHQVRPIGHYRLEARVEAYNAFNHLVWDQPDTTFGGGNFGKVTRKRLDSYGREVQIGFRFTF